MDIQTIKENNDLIAKGLGWKQETDPSKWSGEWFDNDGRRRGGGSKKPLLFHSDWNWVMEGVDKIESIIGPNDLFFNFIISGGFNCYVITSEGDEIVTSDKGQTKLECVYLGLVMFFKYYNK